MKRRLGEVEESCREFKGLYRNLCLRDDVHMLTNNLKGELRTYFDMSMRQWEFEYRKDHQAAMEKFDRVIALANHITPKREFNVSVPASIS